MGRVLGVDFGEKRIGLAISDPGATIAFPREVMSNPGKTGKAAIQVARWALENEVSRVVVGMPFEMDGGRGKQAHRVASFVGLLRKELGDDVPVDEWDERMTSKQAGRAMQSAGVDTRKQRGVLDKVAAALILQGYLDHDASRRAQE